MRPLSPHTIGDGAQAIGSRYGRLWSGVCGLIVPLAVWGGAGFGPALIGARDAAAEIRAGVARETFTLPAGVPLAGYSKRHGKPSGGVHDPVGVRALVLEDDDTVAAIVSCDLLIVDEHLFTAIRQQLVTDGLPGRLIVMVAATHTHSGPGAYGNRFLEKVSMGHFDPRVFDAIVHAVGAAVRRAYASRRPARIAYASRPISGIVVNRMEASGPVDDELILVVVSPAQERDPLALLVNFSAHPTTLGAWNQSVSGDYPGVLVQDLERELPSATVLFLAGSVGDQAPVKAGSGFERAEWIGHALAHTSSALVREAHPESAAPVDAAQETLRLSPAALRIGGWRIPRWLGGRLVDDDATLSVVRAGPVVFLGVPCDLSATLGGRLKQAAQSAGLRPVIVGFASDYIGYCLPADVYARHSYEASMAFNGPRAGELVVEHLITMLQQLATHDR